MTMQSDSIFDVTAKHLGDKVQFQVSAANDDIADALKKAHTEADRIYGYTGKEGSRPTVEVKPVKIA